MHLQIKYLKLNLYTDHNYITMIVDLRSDTVTKPTPTMLEAMMSAKVGDDVFGEDETINTIKVLAVIGGFIAGMSQGIKNARTIKV